MPARGGFVAAQGRRRRRWLREQTTERRRRCDGEADVVVAVGVSTCSFDDASLLHFRQAEALKLQGYDVVQCCRDVISES